MKNKSFTLIELVIAVFVIAVGAMGAFAVLQKVIVSTSLSSSRLVASYLAQEGVEIIRNIRDTNWTEGEDWDNDISETSGSVDYRSLVFPDNVNCAFGNYTLKFDKGLGFYVCSVGGKFDRSIDIQKFDLDTPPDGKVDKIEVSVGVHWKERGIDHLISVQENLYDWYNPGG